MSGAVVRATQLTRTFGARVAVSQLSLTLAAGELVALLGPNGAGKTTTLRMLAGLIEPSHGEVVLQGRPLTAASADSLRQHIGLLTEAPGLWDRLTVRLNLLTYARLYGLPNPHDAVQRALALVGLGDRTRDAAGTLSKGLRQRVALARALLHDPPIVLLDEPTAGLDPASARQVRDLILGSAPTGPNAARLDPQLERGRAARRSDRRPQHRRSWRSTRPPHCDRRFTAAGSRSRWMVPPIDGSRRSPPTDRSRGRGIDAVADRAGRIAGSGSRGRARRQRRADQAGEPDSRARSKRCTWHWSASPEASREGRRGGTDSRPGSQGCRRAVAKSGSHRTGALDGPGRARPGISRRGGRAARIGRRSSATRANSSTPRMQAMGRSPSWPTSPKRRSFRPISSTSSASSFCSFRSSGRWRWRHTR